MSDRLSPIDQALTDKDVDKVALLYRAERVSEVIEAQLRGRSSEAGDMEPFELLLAIVAPPPRVAELSLEKAEELVALGPPFVRERVCPTCERLFMPTGKSKRGPTVQKYCSERCRKAANSRRESIARRRNPKYAAAKREKNAKKQAANLARGQDWLLEYECPSGHERTAENTFLDQRGHRRCQDCIRSQFGWKPVEKRTPSRRRTRTSERTAGGSVSAAGSSRRNVTSGRSG